MVPFPLDVCSATRYSNGNDPVVQARRAGEVFQDGLKGRDTTESSQEASCTAYGAGCCLKPDGDEWRRLGLSRLERSAQGALDSFGKWQLANHVYIPRRRRRSSGLSRLPLKEITMTMHNPA